MPCKCFFGFEDTDKYTISDQEALISIDKVIQWINENMVHITETLQMKIIRQDIINRIENVWVLFN